MVPGFQMLLPIGWMALGFPSPDASPHRRIAGCRVQTLLPHRRIATQLPITTSYCDRDERGPHHHLRAIAASCDRAPCPHRHLRAIATRWASARVRRTTPLLLCSGSQEEMRHTEP
uniref:Uncharacterized protein n=2 Tax=Oryza sativa subsp. japonica TaxID=39947 RepID=Q6YZV0_ORYSJ|nr:hypothetical protein [Oryza sativa Japonica Group]BAD10457.1 hypothetical protein [Oryza sativa Japonica Group]